MKKILLVSLMAFFAATAYVSAQQPFAEFNLESNNVGDIQAFEVGDSVFLTFSDKNPQASGRLRRGFWLAGATRHEIGFNLMEGLPLCAVTRFRGRVVFSYFANNSNTPTLQFLTLGKDDKGVSTSSRKFEMKDEVIGTQSDDKRLTVLTYDNKSVKVLHFAGDSLISERRYELPFGLLKHLKYSTGLMTSGHLFSIPKGSGRLKSYLESSTIIFSLDEPFIKNASKTTVVKIDLTTGKTETASIAAPDDDQFCSHYFGDRLYRFIMSPEQFKVVVYDLSGQALVTKTWLHKTGLQEHLVYVRETETRKIWRGTMSRMMAGSREWEPSIIVQPTADSVELAIGIFYDLNGGAAGAVPNPFSPVSLGYYFGSLSYYQSREEPGLYDYFYVKGTASGGFDLAKRISGSSQQIIDEYEIDKDTNVKKSIDRWFLYLVFKGYANLKDGALGIYQEKRGREKKLILLKYPSK